MKNTKNSKLRYSEYYGMTKIFDKLHENAQQGKQFKNLMQYIRGAAIFLSLMGIEAWEHSAKKVKLIEPR